VLSGPVFELVAGDPTSPVVLHVPHGSRALTALARRSILLDDAELAAELDRMTDTATGLIARRAAGAARRRPWIFANRWSRLVVDPERFPDDTEEMLAVGMGPVYTRTSTGAVLRRDDPVRDAGLLAGHFHPYAAAVAELVDGRLAATGRAVLLDLHSYPSGALPYELHGDDPRPAVCLGVDAFHTPGWLLDAGLRAFDGDVGVNTPFAGCYLPLRHYRRERAVAGLMVELRRDTYLVEPAGPTTDGLDRVVAALAQLIDAAGDGG
jgi:N-formylglutamate deformylase